MRKTLSIAFIGAVALVFTLTACSKDAEVLEAKIWNLSTTKSMMKTQTAIPMKAENNLHYWY